MHRYINRLTIAYLLSRHYTLSIRITLVDEWLENRNNRRNLFNHFRVIANEICLEKFSLSRKLIK